MLITRHSKQRGYGVEIRAEGANRERDGIVCAHCGRYDEIKPGQDPAGHCPVCDKLICMNCVGKGCMPMELRLDQWERFNTGRKYLRWDRLFDIFQKAGGR